MRLLTYEELKGSKGRDVWYRPPRYEARKLFPHLAPRVRVKAQTYQLQNISLGGFAILSKDNSDTEFEVGEVIPVTIQQGAIPIFEGEARVCRTESNILGSKIAFNFLDRVVEFDKLLNRYVHAQIAQKASLLDPSVTPLVSRDYRLFCTDVLQLLRSYRAILQENSALAGETAHDIDPVAAFETCEALLVNQWRPLWKAGNELIRGLTEDKERFEATKEFTELVLTPEFVLGPIWSRSYDKPLGYPGDFAVMNYVYEWKREGAGVYEQLVHRLGLEVTRCVQTRMEIVRDKIAEVVASKPGNEPARILSLGCGPAREVELFLQSPAARAGMAEFTLIDQENLALSYAFERAYPDVLKADGRFRLQCLNMSFTEILRGVGALGALPPQDLIYSVGLLDYLTSRRAMGVIQRLYQTLAPGGVLIIGNMNDGEMSTEWPTEYITDWHVYYRGDREMMQWAANLPNCRAFTQAEETAGVRLLFVQKDG